MKRVLVTGGTGMVGASLVRRLCAKECDVSVFSRPGSNRSRIDGIPELNVLEGDLGDIGSIERSLEAAAPDVLFHLASTPFNPPLPDETHFSVNTQGMVNLITALESFPKVRVIYTGTAAVYGSASGRPETTALTPDTILGATKAAGSILMQTHGRMTGRRTVELRLFTPYGPWEKKTRLIPSIILSALDGKPVKTSAGLQSRDFIFIDDLVDAMIIVGEMDGKGPDCFNLGSGTGIPVRHIVETVLDLMGNPVAVDIGALPTRPDEIMEMSANIAHATEILGWRPKTDIADGLKTTIDWVSANLDTVRNLV